jgi:hypothetical protein
MDAFNERLMIDAVRKEKSLPGLYILSMVFRYPLRGVSGHMPSMPQKNYTGADR